MAEVSYGWKRLISGFSRCCSRILLISTNSSSLFACSAYTMSASDILSASWYQCILEYLPSLVQIFFCAVTLEKPDGVVPVGREIFHLLLLLTGGSVLERSLS